MTTTTVPAGPRSRRGGMPGLGRLVRTEAKLFVRSPGDVFFALIFPTVLLVAVGFVIPGMRETIVEPGSPYDGLQVIATYAPVALAAAAATASLMSFPVVIATYRAQGVLRRLSTTPMRPQGVLLAQVTIAIVVIAVAAALAIAAGFLAFDLPVIDNPLMLAVGVALSALACLAIGMLVAAIVPTISLANAVASLLYFPLLFLGGMWLPLPLMPDGLARVASFSPLGAGVEVMSAAWIGAPVPGAQVLVLLAYPVVLLPIAAKVFRWS
ncbi:ABC-2 type transporter [Beutenbergia cavernae DSM 12333]|uniref:Transport permease protein n=1 Tax=Beutenbergia cavernae (strain ATCC BAA-8 / DSM 12333 / CCUG 43141 / JCM 11478 / NBRC 16432 / NCIMB 13614 / HKI 0122) TaxID=471853 RepID=C5BX69_BEUC1|nr:ABC transporter permease [Beutenbergia cavernae]ACQ78744.1 ABC-2 type transporter [Beutenbergia cavernae DSM 12333]